MRSKKGRSAGEAGTGLSFPSHQTNLGALGSPSTSSSLSPLSTAIFSTACEGWKLLGPSSQRYLPSSEVMEVMFPPTRSLASVTSTLDARSACSSASACAVHSPEIPPPTTTQSYVSSAAWHAVLRGRSSLVALHGPLGVLCTPRTPFLVLRRSVVRAIGVFAMAMAVRDGTRRKRTCAFVAPLDPPRNARRRGKQRVAEKILDACGGSRGNHRADPRIEPYRVEER
eukprot:scaffold574_cov333-Pavlova_lutheri.AAC.15